MKHRWRALPWVLLCACKPSAPEITVPPVVEAVAPAPVGEIPDRDGDGALDASDRCPDEPEDLDGYEDDDGCADRDNDGDKILDAHAFVAGRWTNCDYGLINGVAQDCRNMPEDPDGVADSDGCPEYDFDHCQLQMDSIPLDRRGRPSADAPRILDELAATLHAAPGIAIRVAAHLDRRDGLEAAKTVTRRVAEGVIDELVRRGIVRERLEAIGLGSEMPVADNRTAAGRARNRRVEFTLQSCADYRTRRPPGPDLPQVCR
jgi:hypothetical protein